MMSDPTPHSLPPQPLFWEKLHPSVWAHPFWPVLVQIKHQAEAAHSKAVRIRLVPQGLETPSRRTLLVTGSYRPVMRYGMTKRMWHGSTKLMSLGRMKGGNGNFSSYSTLLIGNQCTYNAARLRFGWTLSRFYADMWKALFREQSDAQGKWSNSIISNSIVWFHHLSSSYFNVTCGFWTRVWEDYLPVDLVLNA